MTTIEEQFAAELDALGSKYPTTLKPFEVQVFWDELRAIISRFREAKEGIENGAEKTDVEQITDELGSPVWVVSIDGINTNTAPRSYREAREQAHKIAERNESWYGIQVARV